MNRKLIASTTVAALLALSACSSDDDDDELSPGDETSEEAPGGESDDREISSDPSGDDTSAVAGLWNASTDDDARYVAISTDGLYTSYDDQQDVLGSGENCYIVTPMQLDVELAAGEGEPATFSVADGRSFTAAVDGEALAVTFISDDSQEGGAEIDTDPRSWSAVEGIATEDLSVCAGESPADEENLLPGEEPEEGGQTSMPAPGTDPDAPPEIDPEPSDTDTSAVAGLWIADSDGPAERVDRRYVLISDNGLYTDYDDQQDASGEGENCYVVTRRRLDFETGEPTSGTYSVSGLSSFTLTLAADGDTLTVGSDETDGGSQPIVWERAGDGIAPESLTACDL